MRLNQVTVMMPDLAAGWNLYSTLGLKPIVDARPRYVRFMCPDGDSTLSLHQGDNAGGGTTVYFECENLDETVGELRQAGLRFVSGPEDKSWLWREAELLDPGGNRIILYYAGSNRLNPPWRIGSRRDAAATKVAAGPSPKASPMSSDDAIEIADWSPEWPESFRHKAFVIRAALGDRALRIDHVGSTSIKGLAAKPIIDIQVSVVAFEPIETIIEPLQEIGYMRQDNPDLAKRYFRESPGNERTHIHVRCLGSWHEQWSLLFRDYMRVHLEEHAPYVALKRALASQYRHDRAAYTDGKADHLWAIIRRADRLAADVGWLPPRSDR